MKTTSDKLILLVAGGSGKRMGNEVPKQFLRLAGRSILGINLRRFYKVFPEARYVLVLPEEQNEAWQEICRKEDLPEHETCSGGEERFFSVRNGLEKIRNESYVAIHDGVRPFASEETIRKAFQSAKQSGSGIPFLPMTDSVRHYDNNKHYPLDRKKIVSVQTPQVFKSELILRAYKQEFSPLLTDDASVVEKSGEAVFLSQGNPENIKITRPLDLLFAEAILSGIESL